MDISFASAASQGKKKGVRHQAIQMESREPTLFHTPKEQYHHDEETIVSNF